MKGFLENSSGNSENDGMHHLKWDKVKLPIQEVGLGIYGLKLRKEIIQWKGCPMGKDHSCQRGTIHMGFKLGTKSLNSLMGHGGISCLIVTSSTIDAFVK